MKDQPGTLQQQQPEIPEPRQQSPLAKSSANPLRLSPIQEFMARMQEINDSIARRAYDLFERRGYAHGFDSEDWFKAESEVLWPLRLEVTDTPDALVARARVSGFEPSQLTVSVEPRRLAVAGRRESTTAAGASAPEDPASSESVQFFDMMDLPADVEPTQAMATLKGDVLEVTLPKTTGATSEPMKRPKARTQVA